MRVLIDVVHPAQVHVFREVACRLLADGDKVLFSGRDKDVTMDLLAALDLPHVCLGAQRSGRLGLMYELAERNARMLRLARSYRPDVMLALAGVAICPVGKLLRIPTVLLDEAEHAWAQRAISLPFATEILTGTGYLEELGPRQVPFAGVWVQAYLEPPPRQVARVRLAGYGVDVDEPYALVRVVSWDAAHDLGRSGVSERTLGEIVARLSDHVRVYVSSERRLPSALESMRCPVAVDAIHDMLAGARLYLGEGATMAAEAAVLGVPSVYGGPLRWGYLRALEERYQLLHLADDLSSGVATALAILDDSSARVRWKERAAVLWEESDDLVGVMVNALRRVANRPSSVTALPAKLQPAEPPPAPTASPRTSIVVCTRNRADALRCCLDHLEAITCREPWELIVVDNASTDHTALVIEQFAASSRHRVRTVHEPRPGSGWARNAGIAEAHADIVAFVDDDCYVPPDYIERLLEIFANNKITYASGRVELHDPTDQPLATRTRPRVRRQRPGSFVLPGALASANCAIRREAAQAIGGFDTRLGAGTPFPCEDVDFFARLSRAGFHGGHYPGLLVYHHHRRKSRAQAEAARREYDHGRGAYYAKTLLDSPHKLHALAFWAGTTWRRFPSGTLRELGAGLRYVIDRLATRGE